MAFQVGAGTYAAHLTPESASISSSAISSEGDEIEGSPHGLNEKPEEERLSKQAAKQQKYLPASRNKQRTAMDTLDS